MLVDRKGSSGIEWAVVAGYAALLLSLLPLQPLWLDELMEVVGTAGLPLRDVITGYAAHSAGQSPLGAVEEAFSIQLLGYSTFAARLPAAIASLLACAGMLALARRAGLRQASVALLLFASFPLVLRYGAEARPYSQAVAVVVWLSVLFLDLLRKPALRLLAMYAALLAIGLYTQPYVLFAAVSQAAFLVVRKRWGLLLPFLAMLFIAASAYLPWYLHSRGYWRQEVEVSQLHFHLQAKLALLIPRELLGSGYLGTAAAALLAAYGIPYLRDRGNQCLLWISMTLVPVCLVVLADVAFDYFFAIRQVVFVLPALAISSAAGLERLYQEKGRRLAGITAFLLLSVNAGYAIRWFTKPHENWSVAAQALKRSIDSGACFLALPAGTNTYYEFFQPALQGHECSSEADVEKRSTIAIAVSPYQVDQNFEREVQMKLKSAGFHNLDAEGGGRPEIQIYQR